METKFENDPVAGLQNFLETGLKTETEEKKLVINIF